VIGCDTERSAEVLREIYAPLTDGSYYEKADSIPQPRSSTVPAPIIVTSTKSAELIKHASNAFLAMKISFINAVASVCESVGADVNQVVHAWHRRAHRAALPESRHRLRWIVFPKDVMAFRAVARNAVTTSACSMRSCASTRPAQRFLRKIRSALWTLRGKNLGVLGLAFKGGTTTLRSPALFLVQSLLQEGSKITAYDPAAMERTQEAMSSGITFAQFGILKRLTTRMHC